MTKKTRWRQERTCGCTLMDLHACGDIPGVRRGPSTTTWTFVTDYFAADRRLVDCLAMPQASACATCESVCFLLLSIAFLEAWPSTPLAQRLVATSFRHSDCVGDLSVTRKHRCAKELAEPARKTESHNLCLIPGEASCCKFPLLATCGLVCSQVIPANCLGVGQVRPGRR